MGAGRSGMNIFGPMTPRRVRQLWYAPVLGLSTALMMGRLLVLARLLDVANFAHLSVALLVSSTFLMLGSLGLQFLLQRDMPVMLVHGRERAARILLAQSVLATYAAAVLALVVILAAPVQFGAPTRVALLGLLHGLAQQLFLLSCVESRSRGEPLRYAVQMLVRSVILIGVGLGVAAATRSADEVVAAEALVSLALAHEFLWKTVAGARPDMRGILELGVRRLFRIEWPAAFALLLVSLLGFFLMNVDRWAAASRLDLRAFGNYSFAGIVLTIGVSAQALLNASVYPMLARLHAREGQAACFSVAARLSLVLLAGSLVLAVPAHFLGVQALRIWYPKYDLAPSLLPIFLLVAAFRVSDFWSSYMMITGHHNRLLKTNLLAGVAGGAVWLLFSPPWRATGQVQPWALLAAALTVTGYVAVAWTSWAASRSGARQ